MIDELLKPPKTPKFETLSPCLEVFKFKFSEKINLPKEEIFEKITPYEIKGYVRPNKKKIELPTCPESFKLVTMEYGSLCKGIRKKIKESSKKSFPHQITFDIWLEEKYVNIFLFSQCCKITGSKNLEEAMKGFICLEKALQDIGCNPILLTEIENVMTIISFNLHFNISKEKLKEIANSKKIICIHNPGSDDAITIRYPMGQLLKNGNERFFHFRIEHTGSVIFIGKEPEKMKKPYETFTKLIEEIRAQIEF